MSGHAEAVVREIPTPDHSTIKTAMVPLPAFSLLQRHGTSKYSHEVCNISCSHLVRSNLHSRFQADDVVFAPSDRVTEQQVLAVSLYKSRPSCGTAIARVSRPKKEAHSTKILLNLTSASRSRISTENFKRIYLRRWGDRGPFGRGGIPHTTFHPLRSVNSAAVGGRTEVTSFLLVILYPIKHNTSAGNQDCPEYHRIQGDSRLNKQKREAKQQTA